jgi:hypothetical protein
MKMLTWSMGLFMSLLLSQLATAQSAVYVSPSGNDTNPGTQGSPVLTLSHALDLSRSSGVKKIILRGGKYYGVGVKLDNRDQGLTITNYKGEVPMLYGGKIVSQFQPEGKFVYASVPGSNNRSWDFRMILIGDSLRSRARVPAQGALTLNNQFNAKILAATQGYYSQQPKDSQMRILQFKPRDIPNNLDINNAELTIYHQWDESYVGVQNIDTVNHTLTFTYPASRPLGAYVDNNPNARQYVIWNTREGMTQPGQWYLDRTRQRLYYWPQSGESASNLQVLVPFYNHIIYFSKGADHITLSGLYFSAASNVLQNEKMTAWNVDGAIEGTSNYTTLSNLTIQNTTGGGIKITGQGNLIQNLKIYQSGGPGIVTTGPGVRIDGAQINRVGVVFAGAAGMNVGGNNDTISNCIIAHCPYSGISLGGANDLIYNNLITDYMYFFIDGAAIYSGAVQSARIFNNILIGTNIAQPQRFTMGLYFDEKSTGCFAQNNLVINSGNALHLHIADHHDISNNIFLDAGRQFIRAENSKYMAIDSNLFYSAQFQMYAPDSDLASFTANAVYVSNLNASAQPIIRSEFTATNAKGYVPPPNNISLQAWMNKQGLNKYVILSRFTPAQLNTILQNH